MSALALHRIRENIAAHAHGEDASTLDLGNCGMAEAPEGIGVYIRCVFTESNYFCKKYHHMVLIIESPDEQVLQTIAELIRPFRAVVRKAPQGCCCRYRLARRAQAPRGTGAEIQRRAKTRFTDSPTPHQLAL